MSINTPKCSMSIRFSFCLTLSWICWTLLSHELHKYLLNFSFFPLSKLYSVKHTGALIIIWQVNQACWVENCFVFSFQMDSLFWQNDMNCRRESLLEISHKNSIKLWEEQWMKFCDFYLHDLGHAWWLTAVQCCNAVWDTFFF